MRSGTTRLCFALAIVLSHTGTVSAQTVSPKIPSPQDDGDEFFSDGLEIESDFRPVGEALDRDRERPDLDHMSDPTTVGDALLWVPRIVLFPAYLVVDFAIRRPLGFVARAVEKHRVVPWIVHLSTWGDRDGPDPNGGIVPVVRIDAGTNPAFGLRYFVDDLIAPGTDFQVRADSNFRRNVTVDLRGETALGERLRVGAFGQLERRDDYLFHGIGPQTTADDETRFLRRKLFAGVEGKLAPGAPGFGAELHLEASDNRFDCSSDPDLDICGPDNVFGTGDERFDPDAVPLFQRGYALGRAKATLIYDSRRPRPANGSGVRLTSFARWGIGLETSSIHFMRLGGEVAGFWDILNQRTLSLRVRGELASPIAGGEIPFAELITLGGVETMRGFLHSRFHGRSALVGTLQYRYPAWSFFDGTLFVEAGNVFGEDFDQFDPGALRGSAGFGIRTIENRHTSVDVLLAIGTSRLDASGFEVEHIRFSLGTNWGF